MRTFVITIPSRKKYILEHCQNHNLKVEIFDAIIGNNIGLLPEQYNKLEFPTLNVKLSFGEVGCALSHYLLWNLLKYLPEEEFFILEDDCMFCEDFVNKFKNIYSSLPTDWEMAYVGWIKYGYDIIPIHISEGLSIRIPSATHAYIIKKSALPILINSLHPINSPIDLQIIDKALKKLKYYVFDPSLIEQKSYMNLSDSEWMSSCYNWSADINNLKNSLYRNFNFISGWYNTETDQVNFWKWSKKEFKFICPPMKELLLEFSSIIENKLIVSVDGTVYLYDVTCGMNKITIPMSNSSSVLISGGLQDGYIPCQSDNTSADTRELGICLMNLTMILNDLISIPTNIRELY